MRDEKTFILVLCLLLFLLSGCAQNQEGGAANGYEGEQQVEVVNGYQIDKGEYTEYFLVTAEEFIASFNNSIMEKGYQPMELLESSSDPYYRYSDNGETWTLVVDTRSESDHAYDVTGKDSRGCITKVQLSLFSDSEERAKKNGDMLYALIHLFNPGMQEQICDALYIFNEAPEGMARKRILTCGNARYTFVYDEGNEKYTSPDFYIEPAEIETEYIPETKPAALKPEA